MVGREILVSVWLLFAGLASADELTGVVVNSANEPLPNVRVHLCNMEQAYIGSASSRVLDSVMTDTKGEFQVTVPNDWYQTPMVWRQELSLTSHSAAWGNGCLLVSRSLPLPRRKLTLRLEPWTPQTITLLKSDGEPLGGARVTLAGLRLPPQTFRIQPESDHRTLAALPEGELRSSGISDDGGKVELMLPERESVGMLQVDVDPQWSVGWSVPSKVPSDWFVTLKIPEVREIPIRVQGVSSERGDRPWTIVGSRHAPVGPMLVGYSRTTIDKQGNGRVRIFPEASVTVYGDTAPEKCVLPFQPVKADFLDALQVSVEPRVQVQGRVITEHADVAAAIDLFCASDNDWSPLRVKTDATGRFQALLPPGQAIVTPGERSGYRQKDFGPESLQHVPASTKTVDLGDIRVQQLGRLSGKVVDEAGSPAAGATVVAIWEDQIEMGENSLTMSREEYLQTDVDGGFVVTGIDPAAEPLLAARLEDASTEELRSYALDDQTTDVILTLSRMAPVHISGRIGTRSQASGNEANIVLRHRWKSPQFDGHLPVGNEVEDVRTVIDPQGNFRTDRPVPPWGEYIAIVRPQTPREVNSGWHAAQAGKELVFPPMEDAHGLPIHGHVFNLAGEPITGARVTVYTSSSQLQVDCAEDGSFSVEPPAGRLPLLIAEADGYLSNGTPVLDGTDTYVLQLPRLDQLTVRQADTLPVDSVWSDARRRELAIKLLEGFTEVDTDLRGRIDQVIARHLPDRFLAQRQGHPVPDDDMGQILISSLAIALAADRPAEGLRLLDSLAEKNGQVSVFGLLHFESRATFELPKRLELLARAAQDVRGWQEPAHRIAALGLVAARLLELGQSESGEALLREFLPDAKQLSPAEFSGYARGLFATALARIDLTGALELIEPLNDSSEYNRHLQNMAHELANIRPDAAISLVDRVRGPDNDDFQPVISDRDSVIQRVCYRMICVAPEKAIQLGRTISNKTVAAHCWGLMSESILQQPQIGDADRTRARQLHDEAWDMLTQVGRQADHSETFYNFPSTFSAILLQQTVRVAPDQVPYRVWQTIALRPLPKQVEAREQSLNTSVSQMALLLAEVDRGRAYELLQWLPTPASGPDARHFLQYVQSCRSMPALTAEIQPEQCEAYVEALSSASMRNELRLDFIKALLRSGESRARAIRNDLGLWYPDDKDLGSD